MTEAGDYDTQHWRPIQHINRACEIIDQIENRTLRSAEAAQVAALAAQAHAQIAHAKMIGKLPAPM